MTRRLRFMLCLCIVVPCANACGDGSEQGTPRKNQTSTSPSTDPADAEVVPDGGEKIRDAGPLPTQDAASNNLSDASAVAPSLEDVLTVCIDACTTQSDCLSLSKAQCSAECEAQAAALAEQDCMGEAAAEMKCLATLSCDELQSYGQRGRRTNALCGEQARVYFAHCTLNGGEVPDECAENCAQSAACNLLGTSSLEACQEDCLLRATHIEWTRIAACLSDFLAFQACAAQQTCREMRAFREQGTPPAACQSLIDAANRDCGP